MTLINLIFQQQHNYALFSKRDLFNGINSCSIITKFNQADLAQLGERQTEEIKTSVKLSGGPVFDPQNSHQFLPLFLLLVFQVA